MNPPTVDLFNEQVEVGEQFSRYGAGSPYSPDRDRHADFFAAHVTPR